MTPLSYLITRMSSVSLLSFVSLIYTTRKSLKQQRSNAHFNILEYQHSNTNARTQIPALNCLLAPFGMAFSNRIYSGNFRVGTKSVQYSSGTSIARFPKEGRLLFAESLMDETESGRSSVRTPPILSPISRKPHNNKKGTRSTSS